MYRDISPELLRLVEPIVAAHGLELVDATLRGRSHLRVVLDTPQGDGSVKLDDCAAVSRELGPALDVADLVPGPYTLEVSSPGVDRVLAREIDFERAVGRCVALETRAPLQGRRRFKGELTAFDASGASLRTDGGELRIPFERIARAKSLYPSETASQGR